VGFGNGLFFVFHVFVAYVVGLNISNKSAGDIIDWSVFGGAMIFAAANLFLAIMNFFAISPAKERYYKFGIVFLIIPLALGSILFSLSFFLTIFVLSHI
jgi:hypothetical protein